MFVVTRDGQKLKVDTSKLNTDEWFPFTQHVALYTDSTHLNEVWVAEFLRNKLNSEGKVSTDGEQLDYVGEKIYNHEPTKEELLYEMSARGLVRMDIVMVHKAYMLDEGEE